MFGKGTRSLFIILAAAVLSLGTFQSDSQARSVMPSSGRAVAAADYGCFWLNFSAMINGCGSAKRLEMSLPVDASQWYNVRVNAFGAGPANNVGCEAVAVNESVTLLWSYGVKWLPAFGSAQNIWTTTWVPGGGAMYLYCDVHPNGAVNTIVY